MENDVSKPRETSHRTYHIAEIGGRFGRSIHQTGRSGKLGNGRLRRRGGKDFLGTNEVRRFFRVLLQSRYVRRQHSSVQRPPTTHRVKR